MLLCPHPHSRNTGRIMSVESGDDVAGTRWDATAAESPPWVCAATSCLPSCCFSAAFSASSSKILCEHVWSTVWSIAPATCDTSANAAATVAANWVRSHRRRQLDAHRWMGEPQKRKHTQRDLG